MIVFILIALFFILLTFYAATCKMTKRGQCQYSLQRLVDISFLLDKNIVDYDIEEGDESKTVWRTGHPPLIYLCLKSPEGEEYDNNTVMRVFIHELAHLTSPEPGHGPIFLQIEEELVKRAIELKVLEEDYTVDPLYPCIP